MSSAPDNPLPWSSHFLALRADASLIDSTGLQAVLTRQLAVAQSTWPQFRLSEETLLEHWAQVTVGTNLADLETLAAADLALVTACLRKHPVALRALSDLLREETQRIARRNQLAWLDAAELESKLAEHLLVAAEGEEPALAQYQGRGPLRAWLQVCAMRLAVRQAAKAKREITLDDEVLGIAEAALPSLELQKVKQQYRGELASAFRASLAALSARERNVLRQHYLDGLSLDRIAALYRVHRITIFRWIDAARQSILAGTRDRLAEQAGLPRLEVDSLVAQMVSQLDVSLTVLLQENAPAM